MAQGVLKKQQPKKKLAVQKRNAGKLSIKNAKSLKPKRDKARKIAEQTRKHLSVLTKTTESNTSAKVCHLDILKKDTKKKT